MSDGLPARGWEEGHPGPDPPRAVPRRVTPPALPLGFPEYPPGGTAPFWAGPALVVGPHPRGEVTPPRCFSSAPPTLTPAPPPRASCGLSPRCEICGYQCRQRASLNWHMKKHTAEVQYNFTCERCGKRFEKLDSVKFHTLKSHPDHKPA